MDALNLISVVSQHRFKLYKQEREYRVLPKALGMRQWMMASH